MSTPLLLLFVGKRPAPLDTRATRSTTQQNLFPNRLDRPTQCRPRSAGSLSRHRRCTPPNWDVDCRDTRSLGQVRCQEVGICAECVLAPRLSPATRNAVAHDYPHLPRLCVQSAQRCLNRQRFAKGVNPFVQQTSGSACS